MKNGREFERRDGWNRGRLWKMNGSMESGRRRFHIRMEGM